MNEKFHTYELKYTSEQVERFNKIIEKNGLVDENPDEFIFHITNENGKEKIIHLAKKEEIDLVIGKDKRGDNRTIGIDIEDAVEAIKNFPELSFKEALIKLDPRDSEGNQKYPALYN